MSVEVAPDALAGTVESFGPAYLLTLGDAPRPHVVAVRPAVVDGVLHVPDLGRTSRRNAAGNGAVTLLWPPPAEDGYSLIVDGRAVLAGDGLVVTPERAVLHRSAPAPRPRPTEGARPTASSSPWSPGPAAGLPRFRPGFPLPGPSGVVPQGSA